MTQALIQLNGVTGSNTDLPIGTPVALNNVNNGGELTYLWVIDYQPAGPNDNISNPVIQNPSITPNKQDTYKITLIVNQSLPDEARDSVVIGIRRLKTRIRVPAATETTEANTLAGWAADTNLTLDLIDTTVADPGVCVCQLAALGLDLLHVVAFSGAATIMSGLPEQEDILSVTATNSSTAGGTYIPLGLIVGPVTASAPLTIGSLVYVRRFGLAPYVVSGSKGDPVYMTDTGTITATPGTNSRQVGTIISASEIYFDGALTPQPSSGFTAGNDLSGTSTSQEVIGFYSNPLDSSMASPSSGDFIQFLSSTWQAITAATLTAALVVASFPPGSNGQILTTVLGATAWAAAPSGFTAGGDLSGTSTSQTVVSISGSSPVLIENASVFEWADGVATPTLTQATRTTDNPPQNLEIHAQYPWVSATGSNRLPGTVTMTLYDPHFLLAGGFLIQYGTTPLIRMGEWMGFQTAGAAIYFQDGGSPSTTNWGILAEASALKIQAPTSGTLELGGTGDGGTFYLTVGSLSSTVPGVSINSGTVGAPIYVFDPSTTANLHFTVTASTASIGWDQANAGQPGKTLTIYGQQSGSGTHAGGIIALTPGAGSGGGAAGTVQVTTLAGNGSGYATLDNSGNVGFTSTVPSGGISPGTAGQIFVSNATPTAVWTSLISYETTHGRFTSGGGGSDWSATIGPFPGYETTNAALYLLANGVSPNTTNWAIQANSSATIFSGPTLEFEISGSNTVLYFPSAIVAYFGATAATAPIVLDWTTITTPLFHSGTSATSLTVGTNKAAGSLILQSDSQVTAMTLAGGVSPYITVVPNLFQWDAGTTTPTLTQVVNGSGAGVLMLIQAQQGNVAGNGVGGALSLSSGLGGGTGTAGELQLQIGGVAVMTVDPVGSGTQYQTTSIGSWLYNHVTKSSNYTINSGGNNDYMITATAALTLTLPAPHAGMFFIVNIDFDTTSANLIIDRHASEKINGTAGNLTITGATFKFTVLFITSNGVDFFVRAAVN